MTLYDWFVLMLVATLIAAAVHAIRVRMNRRIASILDADKLDSLRMDELYDEATAAHPKLSPSRALGKLYRQYGTTLRLSRAGFGDPTYRSIRKHIVRDRILIARREMMELRREFEEEFEGISIPDSARVSHPN